jgi:hypothetical protein
MHASVNVLPDPAGPTSAVNDPPFDVEIDPAKRLAAAHALT